MSYLFDTSAISEVLRPRPAPEYARWLQTVPREAQLTSAIVAGELLAGAHRAAAAEKWLARIERDVLPTLTVLPFDLACAAACGRLRARLSDAGTPIGDADTMIAATALHHDLTVVTANVRHFARVPGLEVRGVR